ncbi:MAG: glycosyltransferase, partial [Campylobacterales bacterium]
RATLQQILELESNLVQRADWTVAVTPQDLSQFQRWGIKRGILAPNGTSPRKVDWGVLEETRRKLEGLKFLLFVGSNYPPNVRGFWKMVGNLSYLSPAEGIVAAGRIGEILIESLPPELELWKRYLEGRLITPGFISEEELTALYLLSNGVLIPILHGGGSNLKTAEALYFNRPIISTKFGLRGVSGEELAGIPVEVTETPEQFQWKIRQLLEAPPPVPTPGNLQFNPQFLWERTLQPLSQILK